MVINVIGDQFCLIFDFFNLYVALVTRTEVCFCLFVVLTCFYLSLIKLSLLNNENVLNNVSQGVKYDIKNKRRF